MIKFLIVEQDLRVSGTSQGIISRSFLAKLRMAYPTAVIDVAYVKPHRNNEQLNLLPVDNITEYIVDLKIPKSIKFWNRFYWRIFHQSLNEKHIYKQYGKQIKKIKYETYNHIFIRSAGLNAETIIGSKDLPILQNAILTYNEPYPDFWCSGSKKKLDNLDLFKLKNMQEVVEQAKGCLSTKFLARDLEFLYGARKLFRTLPHQYDGSVFDMSDSKEVFEKKKKVTLAYHGAIQFGRNIEELLDVYQELIEQSKLIADNSEFVLRLKSSDFNRLQKKYKTVKNIRILPSVNFSNSAYEQKYLTDINILLENGPYYCSVLLGKAPLLAAIGKPVFLLSPFRSELRELISNEDLISTYGNRSEIKQKLSNLILSIFDNREFKNPFGDYFSDDNFKTLMDKMLSIN